MNGQLPELIQTFAQRCALIERPNERRRLGGSCAFVGTPSSCIPCLPVSPYWQRRSWRCVCPWALLPAQAPIASPSPWCLHRALWPDNSCQLLLCCVASIPVETLSPRCSQPTPVRGHLLAPWWTWMVIIHRIFFCNQILLFASWAAHLLRINLCKCMPTWACEREEIVVYARCIKPCEQQMGMYLSESQ